MLTISTISNDNVSIKITYNQLYNIIYYKVIIVDIKFMCTLLVHATFCTDNMISLNFVMI